MYAEDKTCLNDMLTTCILQDQMIKKCEVYFIFGTSRNLRMRISQLSLCFKRRLMIREGRGISNKKMKSSVFITSFIISTNTTYKSNNFVHWKIAVLQLGNKKPQKYSSQLDIFFWRTLFHIEIVHILKKPQ